MMPEEALFIKQFDTDVSDVARCKSVLNDDYLFMDQKLITWLKFALMPHSNLLTPYQEPQKDKVLKLGHSYISSLREQFIRKKTRATVSVPRFKFSHHPIITSSSGAFDRI